MKSKSKDGFFFGHSCLVSVYDFIFKSSFFSVKKTKESRFNPTGFWFSNLKNSRNNLPKANCLWSIKSLLKNQKRITRKKKCEIFSSRQKLAVIKVYDSRELSNCRRILIKVCVRGQLGSILSFKLQHNWKTSSWTSFRWAYMWAKYWQVWIGRQRRCSSTVVPNPERMCPLGQPKRAWQCQSSKQCQLKKCWLYDLPEWCPYSESTFLLQTVLSGG